MDKLFEHLPAIITAAAQSQLGILALLVVALSVLHAIFLPTALSVLAIMFVPPVHMFRQLKGAYALSWFGALWRTLMLAFFGCITAITIFMLLLLALGVMH